MKNWGAIFDWDGVIVDSGWAHAQSWERMAQEIGKPLVPGFFNRSFGMKNERIIPELLHWSQDAAEVSRLGRRKEEHYRDIIRDAGIQALPGAATLLQRLSEARVPCVVGSSTERANIDCGLAVIGLREYFADIVCGCDVTHGKPAPDIFLLAAQRIHRAPARCVVFEDAHVGIEAARAGGMKVVAVASTNAYDSLLHADRVVHRLDEVEPAELAGWFTE